MTTIRRSIINRMDLFKISILLSILVAMLVITNAVQAAPVTTRSRAEAVQERGLRRLQSHRREIKNNLATFKSRMESALKQFEASLGVFFASLDKEIEERKRNMCLFFGRQEYCPEPELPIVSEGHTVLVNFDVMASFFNPVKNQTDSSPCEGWGGNVCKAYEEGLNPVAASRDIVNYPLGKGSKIRIKSLSFIAECKAYDGKIMTVMDKLSDCLDRNMDFRTGRCRKPIVNQIDIYIPCEGEPGTEDYCILGIAKARAIGSCQFNITKL